MASMVPIVEFPPAVAFTDQSTLVSPVMVAVKATEPPEPVAAAAGETATVIGVGLVDVPVEDLPEELHPGRSRIAISIDAASDSLVFMDDAPWACGRSAGFARAHINPSGGKNTRDLLALGELF